MDGGPAAAPPEALSVLSASRRGMQATRHRSGAVWITTLSVLSASRRGMQVGRECVPAQGQPKTLSVLSASRRGMQDHGEASFFGWEFQLSVLSASRRGMQEKKRGLAMIGEASLSVLSASRRGMQDYKGRACTLSRGFHFQCSRRAVGGCKFTAHIPYVFGGYDAFSALGEP